MYQLATLLVELDREDEASSLLGADALYRLGRLEDAHKALLLALSRRPHAAPVLARLALLQLRRGFFYDANQVSRPRGATAGQVEMGHSPAEGTGLWAPHSAPLSLDFGAGKTCLSPGLCPLQQGPLTSLTLSLFVCALVLWVVPK